ncbi:MAG: class I SAM-dependent methyltransferase [Chloroflexi bacterium]|nr:class I SAM-dependent methyltransferase [Chloroflexota bacterium]
MEERKRKEAEFHDKVRAKALREDKSEYERLTFSTRFYSVVRSSRAFVNGWLLERCPNRKALDYCCGNGEVSLFLAKNGAEVTGIDISGESIKNAKEDAIREGIEKNASFLVMDAENLDFEDNCFDVAVCSGILHHLDIERAYAELARVLKPGGEIICNEPLAYNPIIALYRKMTPHLRTEWEAEHILTRGSVELAKKYFGKVETRFFHLASLAAVPFRNLPGFRSILSFLEAVDGVVLKLPGLRWLAWQIVFTLSQPNK